MTSPTVHPVIAGRYRVLRTLGAGAHGTVDLAEDVLNGGRRVALKRLEAIVGAGDPEPAAETLRWFLHPRWAEIIDEGRLDEHGRFQVSRYVAGHSLDKIELPLACNEVMRFLEDGARVLRALHRRGLIHYDVTPGNWIREDTVAGPAFTLTDGGLASLGPVRGIARGTPAFMAPEVVEGAPHDHRADLYSLGLVAWRLLVGADPHGIGGAGEVLGRRRRVAAPLLRTARADVPEGLERVVAALLERDPERRPADGSALLALLAEAGVASALEDLTPEEAVAAATGGALVGRTDALTRFRAACHGLVAGVAPTATENDFDSGGDVPAPTVAIQDSVIVVEAPSGAGATRLLREMAGIARAEGVAALALSGRDGAADRRSPLRRVADALGALVGETAVVAGPRDGRIDAEGAVAVDARATERFVDACERVAAKTPVVLLVEDFGDLTATAQEGFRVLSRHLLARAEHPDGRRPLRFLLVIEHGPDDPSLLLIPDAQEPRRPLLSLPPMTEAEVVAVVAERLPGADLPPTDAAALRVASEGLPRTLTALIAEGLRRGDLRRVDARWIWIVDDLRSYRPPRNIPASLQRTLDALSPSARDAITRLALLDEPAPAVLLRALAGTEAAAEVARSPLVAKSHEGDDVRYAPISRGLRDLLRDQPAEDLTVHRTAVLEALDLHPSLDLVADQVSLLAAGGRHGDAFLRLATVSAAAPVTIRARAALAAADLLSLAPDLLTSADHRSVFRRFLVAGPIGLRVADALQKSLPVPPAPEDDETRILLAEDAFSRSLYPRVLEILERPVTAADTLLRARAAVIDLRARVALDARAVTAEFLLTGIRHLRSIGRNTGTVAHSTARAYLLLARYRFETGRIERAIGDTRRAVRVSRHAADRRLLADSLNAHAICLQRSSQDSAAETALSRSSRLAMAIGEIAAATKSLHNLARLMVRRGAGVVAARSLARALSLATRHADYESATVSLLTLSDLYDSQGNPNLARAAAHRASQVATHAQLPRLAIEAVIAEAVLAAASGDLSGAHAAVATAFRLERRADSRVARRSILEGLAQLRMLLGHPRRALRLITRNSLHATRAGAAVAVAATACEGIASLRFDRRHRPVAHVNFRSAIARLIKFARTQPDDPETANALFAHLHSAEFGLSGNEQRLLALLLVQFALSRPGVPGIAGLVREAARRHRQRGSILVGGRLEAALSLLAVRQGRNGDLRGSLSRFLALIDAGTGFPSLSTRLLGIPPEVQALGGALNARVGRATIPARPTDFWLALDSAAFRLSLVAGTHDADDRISSALRLILSLSSRLQTGAGLEALLDSLNEGACRITGAESACIVLTKSENPRDNHVVSSSWETLTHRGGQRLSHTILQRVIKTRQPLLVHDVFSDSELLSRPSIASLSVRSALCVPLIRGEKLFGAMYADSRQGVGNFDRTDLSILSLFAEQAAAAIETTRLLADIQRSYAELRAAQERLVRGERLRVMGELAGGVAHEFNNLLTSILARVQLLSLESIAPPVRREIAMIERAALDAANVVRRLQTFSKTQQQQDFQRVDVGEVCADVVEMLRPLWTTRRLSGRPAVTVRLRVLRGHLVLGEPAELREVFTNLLKNALEALETGGSIILSTVEREGRVRVTVEDDGPGIPPELQSRVFTPFFTTKGERGTGLGLCLSQQIVERHGGELRLEPISTGGTRAVVLLPIASSASTAKEDGAAPETPAIRPISVLVVDDDRDVLEPLCAYLRKSDVVVRAATSGEAAIDLMRAEQPDVLISDIGMPGMSGIDLCRVTLQLNPRIAVILMSGRPSAALATNAHSVGATSLLPKPFTMRQILDLLAQVAAERRV